MITLTATQHAVLSHAIQNTADKLEWFPAKVQGIIRQRVVNGLLNRGLISADGLVTDAAYQALGLTRLEMELAPSPVSEAPVEGTKPAQTATETRRRENSKQAIVIRMLQRPEGATVEQLQAATGWLPHTVRSVFYGTLSKKLGLIIESDKAAGGKRVYHLT
ncbi:DUF3489 domain-containing protein [Iodobacter arcticus]|uniref:DUF3489 domain-containing protein n=1 Tax=Iodobacter arcticus TaxID=590593 RepID=A0ABW2R2M6_9NEIS